MSAQQMLKQAFSPNVWQGIADLLGLSQDSIANRYPVERFFMTFWQQWNHEQVANNSCLYTGLLFSAHSLSDLLPNGDSDKENTREDYSNDNYYADVMRIFMRDIPLPNILRQYLSEYISICQAHKHHQNLNGYPWHRISDYESWWMQLAYYYTHISIIILHTCIERLPEAITLSKPHLKLHSQQPIYILVAISLALRELQSLPSKLVLKDHNDQISSLSIIREQANHANLSLPINNQNKPQNKNLQILKVHMMAYFHAELQQLMRNMSFYPEKMQNVMHAQVDYCLNVLKNIKNTKWQVRTGRQIQSKLNEIAQDVTSSDEPVLSVIDYFRTSFMKLFGKKDLTETDKQDSHTTVLQS